MKPTLICMQIVAISLFSLDLRRAQWEQWDSFLVTLFLNEELMLMRLSISGSDFAGPSLWTGDIGVEQWQFTNGAHPEGHSPCPQRTDKK